MKWGGRRGYRFIYKTSNVISNWIMASPWYIDFEVSFTMLAYNHLQTHFLTYCWTLRMPILWRLNGAMLSAVAGSGYDCSCYTRFYISFFTVNIKNIQWHQRYEKESVRHALHILCPCLAKPPSASTSARICQHSQCHTVHSNVTEFWNLWPGVCEWWNFILTNYCINA